MLRKLRQLQKSESPTLKHFRELAELAERTDQYGSNDRADKQKTSLPIDQIRKQWVQAYKTEYQRITSKKLTNEDIWRTADYADDSVFYRWQKYTCEAPRIEQVLREKWHLRAWRGKQPPKATF